MLSTTMDEVEGGFTTAKNLNAALKSFLKREGSSNPQVASFAKEFRAVAASGKAPAIRAFVERNYPQREIYFTGLARYAHPELIAATVETIINRFADEFNATYQQEETGISVKDAAAFNRIVKEVESVIEQGLSSAGLPVTNFMKNALLSSVFEVGVLDEVLKVVKG